MAPAPKPFYYQFDGTIIGPVTGIDLREAALSSHVVPTTLVANDPNGEWVVAIRIRGLFDERGRPLPHPPETEQILNGSQQAPRIEKPAEIEATPTSGGSGQPNQCYYQVHGNVIGPIAWVELRVLALAGRVIPTTLIANDPNGAWVAASGVRGLFDENVTPLPDLLDKPALVNDCQAAVDFHFDVTRSAEAAIIGQADLLVDSDVEFQGHVGTPIDI